MHTWDFNLTGRMESTRLATIINIVTIRLFADISRANITVFEQSSRNIKLVFHTPILSCTIKVRQNVQTNKWIGLIIGWKLCMRVSFFDSVWCFAIRQHMELQWSTHFNRKQFNIQTTSYKCGVVARINCKSTTFFITWIGGNSEAYQSDPVNSLISLTVFHKFIIYNSWINQ